MYRTILVALDGSEYSLAGGRIALALARSLGSSLLAVHVYDAGIHSSRFREMEPVLPDKYQEESYLTRLRSSHEGLINEGFNALSRGYMEQYIRQAAGLGLEVAEVNREGRNYVELLRIAEERSADLIVLGAYGLGKVNDALLGSTAARVLRFAPCDVLIVRRDMEGNGTVAVGIDGSREAFSALRRASHWARVFGRKLSALSAYDPFFHTQVFHTMAGSLSRERQAEVGLGRQQTLHDQIIDDGLGKLYASFLEQAERECRASGFEVETQLLKGKACTAVAQYASEHAVDLLVVGRYGHHRRDETGIGSNSEALVRVAATSVLVTRDAAGDDDGHTAERATVEHVTTETDTARQAGIRWEDEALVRLERVPPHVRQMAKGAVESFVRSQGKLVVTAADFDGFASRMGMGRPGGGGHD